MDMHGRVRKWDVQKYGVILVIEHAIFEDSFLYIKEGMLSES